MFYNICKVLHKIRSVKLKIPNREEKIYAKNKIKCYKDFYIKTNLKI